MSSILLRPLARGALLSLRQPLHQPLCHPLCQPLSHPIRQPLCHPLRQPSRHYATGHEAGTTRSNHGDDIQSPPATSVSPPSVAPIVIPKSPYEIVPTVGPQYVGTDGMNVPGPDYKGIDLGEGHSGVAVLDTFGEASAFDMAYTSEASMQQIRDLGDRIRPPPLMWYTVRITNPINGRTMDRIMLIDTGAERSTVPLAIQKLGVIPGASENINTHMQNLRVQLGVVEMRLLSRVVKEESDVIDAPNITFAPLQDLLQARLQKLSSRDVTAAVRLQGKIAVVGLDMLVAWKVQIDPALGVLF